MQVKSIPELHSAILLTFIKLPFVIKIFVLSIFECPFYTGFTVCLNSLISLSKNIVPFEVDESCDLFSPTG